MSPAKFETIQAALQLQGDIKVRLEKMGFGVTADRISCDIMDMVLKSDAVKPEIKAIYMEIENGIAT